MENLVIENLVIEKTDVEKTDAEKADAIKKYLSVQEPQGKEEVRFRRKLNVPLSEDRDLFDLFSYSGSSNNLGKLIESEINRLDRLKRLEKDNGSPEILEIDNEAQQLNQSSGGVTDQTTDVLIDDRVNLWYRSYKAIQEEEKYIKSLITKYEEQEVQTLADNTWPSSGAAQEESGGTRVIDNNYLRDISVYLRQLKENLYEVIDRKKELCREVYSNGYDISEYGITQEISDLGYDFVITKGEKVYETAKIVDIKEIIGDVYSKLTQLSSATSQEQDKLLDQIRESFNDTNSGGWEYILDQFKIHGEANGWTQEIMESIEQQGKELVGEYNQDAIDHPVLIKEREEEKVLQEALKGNPYFKEKSFVDRELKITETTELRDKIAPYKKGQDKLKPIYTKDLRSKLMSWRLRHGYTDVFNFNKYAQNDFDYGWKHHCAYIEKFGALPGDLLKSWIKIYVSRSGGYTFRGIIIDTTKFPEGFIWRNKNRYNNKIEGKYQSGNIYYLRSQKTSNTANIASIRSDSSRMLAAYKHFLEACENLSRELNVYYINQIRKTNNEYKIKKESARINIKQIKDLRKHSLTKSRIKFLLHWSSPGRFKQRKSQVVKNLIHPHIDSWADFLEKLRPGKFYNLNSRKVKIDHFTFQGTGYFTQSGLNMDAYLELIKNDRGVMRVAIFPVLDDDRNEIPKVRRAVINPEASHGTGGVTRLPHIGFVEDHVASMTWQGFCLGELSHSENLAAGESKTIEVEQVTELKKRLVEETSEEDAREMKDTVSLDEKISEELNDKVTYEEEQKNKVEQKKLDEKKSTYTKTKSKEEVSKTGLSISAPLGPAPVSGSINISKDITKKDNKTKTDQKLLQDSVTTSNENATKQGRESQSKNINEKIKKAASETSQSNKVSMTRSSESDSLESSKKKETIQMQNNNMGKTLSYYFFQLQNKYELVQKIENVRIVVSPPYETIAKSGINDIRIFHITEIPNICTAFSNRDDALAIFALAYKYAIENYFNKNSKEGLMSGALGSENNSLINSLIELLKNDQSSNPNMIAQYAQILSKVKEQFTEHPLEFKEMVSHSDDQTPNKFTVNSGALYMDTELGKQMATEPYLETRRDIETDLKNAEVEHLRAKTNAGAFYTPPATAPAAEK